MVVFLIGSFLFFSFLSSICFPFFFFYSLSLLVFSPPHTYPTISIYPSFSLSSSFRITSVVVSRTITYLHFSLFVSFSFSYTHTQKFLSISHKQILSHTHVDHRQRSGDGEVARGVFLCVNRDFFLKNLEIGHLLVML